MKNLFTTTVLSNLFVTVAFAQGTIAFQNFSSPSFFAPDYLSDGATKLSGPQYMAELFAGPNTTSLSAIATTPFLSGSSAGFFNGGTQVIPNVPAGGSAFAQVDVWNTAIGASFDQAKATGLPNAWAQSTIFPVTTGSPDGGVPTPPGILTGLTPLSLNGVPEPSTIALIGLGAAVVFLSNLATRLSLAKRS